MYQVNSNMHNYRKAIIIFQFLKDALRGKSDLSMVGTLMKVLCRSAEAIDGIVCVHLRPGIAIMLE